MIPRAPSEAFDTPITIAVIADTHFHRLQGRLPLIVEQALTDADLILHAGDFCTLESWQMLAELGPLRGVAGNNDEATLRAQLPLRREFVFGRFRAAMIHGHGFGRLTARQAAEREFLGRYDLGIFGHSHRAFCARQDGTLLFNPGSPTNRRWEPRHSFGIIHIDEEIDMKLHFLEE